MLIDYYVDVAKSGLNGPPKIVTKSSNKRYKCVYAIK